MPSLVVRVVRRAAQWTRQMRMLQRVNHARNVGQHFGEEVRQPVFGVRLFLFIVEFVSAAYSAQVHVARAPLATWPEAADTVWIPQRQLHTLLEVERLGLDAIIPEGQRHRGSCLHGTPAVLGRS